MDVRRFQSKYQLAEALSALANQKYATLDSVMVQEWIEFDVELRLFFIDPVCEWDEEKNCPKPLTPKKILYTKFWRVDEEDKLRDFERMPRQQCVDRCFFNDSPALAEAERQACEIAAQTLWWLQAESSEPIPVLRQDFMCQRSEPGKAVVHLGELTELGACFLGWDEGPKEVFAAVIRSCFRFDKGFEIQNPAITLVPQERDGENAGDEEEEEEEEAAPAEMSYDEAKKHAAAVQAKLKA